MVMSGRPRDDSCVRDLCAADGAAASSTADRSKTSACKDVDKMLKSLIVMTTRDNGSLVGLTDRACASLTALHPLSV